MIHSIHQTPPQPAGHPATQDLPADAECFIGTHTGHLPAPGATFHRYGRDWRIVESTTTGKGPWTFRARATALPTTPAPTA